MELPQPRPFGTEGRKPTHDFLSLYSHSTAQQDPRPSSQGGYLETHDFLQPLERMGKTRAKEEMSSDMISTAEKPAAAAAQANSVEHILPGGIGTYSISHISYFNQRVPKPEGGAVVPLTVAAQTSSTTDRNDDNSNCTSFTGTGFTLWEESAAKKGKTGKENVGERPATTVSGQWTSSERPSQSSSNNHRNCFSSQSSGQKNMSFMEMMKSAAKGSTQEDELDDEEEFVLKKETSTTTTTTATTPYKGDLRVQVDVKSSDQKANTPRSKHSATEQRRRSKINDRFHMLRELIPHSDQKRDKASFLLEVIEYIQFLQEKVTKYEGPYQGWNHDPAKLMPWRNNHKLRDSFCDQSRGMNGGSGPASVFAAKLDEKNTSASPTIPGSAQNPVESDTSTETTFKAMDHHHGITNKAMPFPLSMQPSFFNPVRSGGALPQFPPRLPSDAENTSISQPQSMLCQTKLCTTDGAVTRDKLKEQELTIEGGRINISTAYSQGLLNTLTQALQNSGVDLSQASISVQIELGKHSNNRIAIPKSIVKDNEIPSGNQGKKLSRVASGENSEQSQKKLKTGRN